MSRWWSYDPDPTEDDYEDFVGDEHWEDDVPESWWADVPSEAVDSQYAAAEPKQ